MRGFFIYSALVALIPFSAAAAENEDEIELKDRLDSVVVSASRAGKNTPVTYTMVGKEQMRRTNPINSLPMTLSLQPSVVAVNEGGTGLGYSKMTIRGTKGSQINVTLNGITLNDAESQEVFWVNIPALTNILSSVQLQRGLGTSANGAGAFGASVNMSTASVGAEPYANLDISYGSYNTFSATVAAGTGLTKSGFYLDLAYSRGYTDGYIRNAKARVQSAYAAIGWMKGNNSLKFTYLMGDQHTGITWNGIDLETYETDRRYNSAGEYTDIYGNVHYYDNQTDNYTQHHLQLNYTHQFPKNVTWSTTFNFTKGDGYYEEYETGKGAQEYNLDNSMGLKLNEVKDDEGHILYYEFNEIPEIINRDDGTVISMTNKGDFIEREAMDNYYLVLNSEVRYTGNKMHFTGGINLSRYDGDHIGQLLWGNRLPEGFDYDAYNAAHTWYLNNGLKNEVNVFARAEYSPVEWMTAYADLQYRGVSLEMAGPDDDGSPLDYSTSWNFFNPRAGLTFSWAGRHKAYVSAALGNREPGRSDIKDVIITNNLIDQNGGDGKREELKPEKMVDVELGYTYSAPKVTASANLYFMEYFDMLLETGRLSDSGYAIKENAGRGYRRGVELAVAWDALPWMRIDANTTLSLNKIKDYVAYIPVYDSDYNFLRNFRQDCGKTDMLMSPSVVGMVQLSFTPFRTLANNSLKTTTLSINGKYVGKQYMDNTSSADRCIPAYFVSNLSLTHEFRLKGGVLGLGAYVNNLFNNMYYADGGASREMYDGSDEVTTYVWIYPQAPLNFMFKLSYRF